MDQSVSGNDCKNNFCIDNLITVRKSLKLSLEKSRTLGLALEKAGPRLEEINQRLPSLEAVVRLIRAGKDALVAVGGHLIKLWALLFLGDNCGLAIQWLEDIIEYLEDNRVANGMYLSNLKTYSRELQNDGKKVHLDGGLLDVLLDKLENEFRRLLAEHSVPLPMLSRH
ncbi:hypothetical protein PVK06_009629 [Gossypium arboreum]|uniref:Uncharacterized protein n=1 Tax=Gossypium arboreum TaxID=29729 RepID=A0ABR0QNX2_GOSAR|nr:hypothetical protein PVK06_009629 [Gossypium arboreum]